MWLARQWVTSSAAVTGLFALYKKAFPFPTAFAPPTFPPQRFNSVSLVHSSLLVPLRIAQNKNDLVPSNLPWAAEWFWSSFPVIGTGMWFWRQVLLPARTRTTRGTSRCPGRSSTRGWRTAARTTWCPTRGPSCSCARTEQWPGSRTGTDLWCWKRQRASHSAVRSTTNATNSGTSYRCVIFELHWWPDCKSAPVIWNI